MTTNQLSVFRFLLDCDVRVPDARRFFDSDSSRWTDKGFSNDFIKWFVTQIIWVIWYESYNSFFAIFEIKSVPSFFQKLLTLLKISFFLLISWWFYRQWNQHNSQNDKGTEKNVIDLGRLKLILGKVGNLAEKNGGSPTNISVVKPLANETRWLLKTLVQLFSSRPLVVWWLYF